MSSVAQEHASEWPGLEGMETRGPIIEEEHAKSTLPRLHAYAYKGDTNGVLQCLTDGDAVHETVVIRNQAGKHVCGITPLFLAAQRGHLNVVKLLVQHGANPAQPAFIQGSADLCSPAQVARLNLHFWVAHHLNRAVAQRKKEDAVIRQAEEMNAAATTEQVVMPLRDLTEWDPSKDDQPQLMTQEARAKILKIDKMNLENWKPDTQPDNSFKPSESRPVDLDELEAEDVVQPKNMDKFLQDANFASWTPEENYDAATSVAATHRTSVDLNTSVLQDSRAQSPIQTPESSNPGYARAGGAPAARAVPISHRATAHAVAAAAMPAPRANRIPNNNRWFTHGSDSEEEDDPALLVSGSKPAAA